MASFFLKPNQEGPALLSTTVPSIETSCSGWFGVAAERMRGMRGAHEAEDRAGFRPCAMRVSFESSTHSCYCFRSRVVGEFSGHDGGRETIFQMCSPESLYSASHGIKAKTAQVLPALKGSTDGTHHDSSVGDGHENFSEVCLGVFPCPPPQPPALPERHQALEHGHDALLAALV